VAEGEPDRSKSFTFLRSPPLSPLSSVPSDRAGDRRSHSPAIDMQKTNLTPPEAPDGLHDLRRGRTRLFAGNRTDDLCCRFPKPCKIFASSQSNASCACSQNRLPLLASSINSNRSLHHQTSQSQTRASSSRSSTRINGSIHQTKNLTSRSPIRLIP
jgi:hypothetical protein